MSFDYPGRALTRIISQYRDDAKLRSLLTLLGQLINTNFENFADVRRLLYSIDDMSGVQLDLIGRVLVKPRPAVLNIDDVFFGYLGTPGAVGYDVAPYYDFSAETEIYIPLPDPAYQRLLKATVIRNTGDCSIDSIIRAAELMTGDRNISLINNQDMTFELLFSIEPDGYTTILLNNFDVIPEPAGVLFSGWSVVEPEFHIYAAVASDDGGLVKIDEEGNELLRVGAYGAEVAINQYRQIYFAQTNSASIVRYEQDGSEVWTFSDSGNVLCIAVDDFGFVYYGTDSGVVRCVSSAGQLVWEFIVSAFDVNDVAVDADGYVYIASQNQTIKKIDQNGNQVWSIDADIGVGVAEERVVAGENGHIYVGGSNTLGKVDSDGNVVWDILIGPSYQLAFDPNGFIYVAFGAGYLRKHDVNGNEIWTIQFFASSMESLSVDANGYIYMGRSSTMKKADTDGNEIWEYIAGNTGDRLTSIAT